MTATPLSFHPQLPGLYAVDPPAISQTGEVELARRSQAGDVEAFNQLVERYQRAVYALCFRMVGDADAADVTQEVFLTAYQNIRQYRGGSLIAWLLRIANNKCLDQLRIRRRRPYVSLDADRGADSAPIEVQDPGESPDHRVLRAELARSLEHKLQELPADQRLAVILSDIHGYNHEEIAAATGWPRGTIKSRLSRGRARLRDALRSAEILPAAQTTVPSS